MYNRSGKDVPGIPDDYRKSLELLRSISSGIRHADDVTHEEFDELQSLGRLVMSLAFQNALSGSETTEDLRNLFTPESLKAFLSPVADDLVNSVANADTQMFYAVIWLYKTRPEVNGGFWCGTNMMSWFDGCREISDRRADETGFRTPRS